MSREEDSRGDHSFGATAPLTLGVEEEVLLVDEQLLLAPVAERVIEALAAEAREGVTTEIFANQIELKTGICATAEEAAAQLASLRREIAVAGARIIGSGLHPADDGGGELIRKPRYDVVREDLDGILDTPPAGLHVHVGMPDPETAIRVANALRVHLPLFGALTANSPFRKGEDTGLASARTAVVASYPRFEVPRAFRDYEEFRAVADQLIAAAGVADYTYLWWDVRPHPKLGTVEVRGMDVQAEVEANAAVAALIQALAAREVDRPTESGLTREAIGESYFQAERHGLEAKLMDADANATPARELAARALGKARPYARELGGEDALEGIERILREGNGADRQRRVHADSGIQGLLRDLARRTS
jgi:carboxylate-amine ligase